MFVGRAFRHDIRALISSGVLTPEGLDSHFSAACSACVIFADAAEVKTTQAEACATEARRDPTRLAKRLTPCNERVAANLGDRSRAGLGHGDLQLPP